MSTGFLEEGRLKMGLGGKGTLRAAGVRDPWGLGGPGEGRGGIWLCSDPPTYTLCAHLVGKPRHLVASGKTAGQVLRGVPWGLGLSEDSPGSSQCPGSHPPSPSM